MYKGVDISSYQTKLKIKDIKKQGFEFAILRAGFTGYGANRQKCKDAAFDDFYEQAKAAKFPIGVYYYSCAKTRSEGEAEAKFLYNIISGKKFEYPIYIDVEDPHWQARDKKGVTDAIIGFCEYLKSRGFLTGVYASSYWFNYRIDTGRLSSYSKWVAAWNASKPAFPFNKFDIWQNSDNGRVGLVRVDTNISFVDFPQLIKYEGHSGHKATKPKETKKKSVATIAQEVISGKWGNGSERKDKLKKAGYDYAKVQAKVNEILAAKKGKSTKEYYTVKTGDNLTKIAKAHNTTIADLVKLNNITDRNLIYAGQKLRIK